MEMSTDTLPIPDILFEQLFDGRMEKHGIREKMMADSSAEKRYLEGRDGILQVYRNDHGASIFVRGSFTPIPWAVFDALIEEFKVELVGEDDHRFWGFATEEECSAYFENQRKEREDEFYSGLISYLRNEPTSFAAGGPGWSDYIQGTIAKELTVSDPGLMAPERRSELLAKIDAIYRNRHCALVRDSDRGRSVQSGRTSAPIMPHLVQTALRSRSRSTVSSGQRSASTTALWWRSPVEQ
jgi:hypothetical protein